MARVKPQLSCETVLSSLAVQFALVQAWASLTSLSSVWQCSSQTKSFRTKLVPKPVNA